MKDCASGHGETIRSVQTESPQVPVVSAGALALKPFDEFTNQLVITWQGQLKQVVETEIGFAQRRIDTPISDVLLQNILKESPGRVDRRLANPFEGKVDRNLSPTAREQLIVCLPQQFRRARPGGILHYQSAARAGRVPYDRLQVQVSAHNHYAAGIVNS